MGGAIGIVIMAMLTVPTIGWRWLLVFAAVPVAVMTFIVPVSFHGGHVWYTLRLWCDLHACTLNRCLHVVCTHMSLKITIETN